MSGTEPDPILGSELSTLEPAAFAALYWEKQPFTTTDRRWVPCTAEALYEALQAATRQLLKGDLPRVRDIQCYVGEAEVVSPAPFMPRQEEMAFESFLARLDRETICQPFTLMVHGIQQFSARVTDQLRRYLVAVNWALGGTPAGGTDVHLMVARYGTSPYGIHKDSNSVLTTVYFGHKTMLIWPFEHFATCVQRESGERIHIKLPLVKASQHQAAARSLKASVGTTIYFPASAWHVGSASSDHLHVSLHVTFGANIDQAAVAREILEELSSSRLRQSAWAPVVARPTYSTEAGWTPEDRFVDDVLVMIASEIANGKKSLRRAAASRWLRRQSLQGLLRGATNPIIANPTRWSQAAIDTELGFYWTALEDEILVAANGRIISVPNIAWVKDTLAVMSSLRGGVSAFELETGPMNDNQRRLCEALAGIGAVVLR